MTLLTFTGAAVFAYVWASRLIRHMSWSENQTLVSRAWILQWAGGSWFIISFLIWLPASTRSLAEEVVRGHVRPWIPIVVYLAWLVLGWAFRTWVPRDAERLRAAGEDLPITFGTWTRRLLLGFTACWGLSGLWYLSLVRA